jgi:methylated-DNA-[protein]-cysteine S-methyltransferase
LAETRENVGVAWGKILMFRTKEDDMTATRDSVLVVDSPIGSLTLTVQSGAVTAVDFGAQDGHEPGERTNAVLAEAARQLAAYFAGELRDFDLPLRASGTPFQLQVWRGLQAIPYGETISYSELAKRIGRPTAARAVGRASGQNPIAVVVPCHRVIGADGTLTGYAGGLDAKAALLALEAPRQKEAR